MGVLKEIYFIQGIGEHELITSNVVKRKLLGVNEGSININKIAQNLLFNK